jgi:ABC-type multidrug transport system fused ATPase/permease subunit
MVTTHLGKGKTILIGLVAAVFSTLLGVLAPAAPAHAASAPAFEWVDTTTIKFNGSAVKTPVNVTGSFVGNVYGTPPGSQTFMAVSNGPIEMSFGCKVSMTLNIYPDAQGKLNYGSGNLIFTTSAPSTCSQDTLKANIAGLVHDPKTGTANISLNGVTISGVDKRGPAGGTDDPSKQTVNITAGMGPASDYTGIPQTDIFMICEAKGDYQNNIDLLYKDCLAKKTGALSANPVTSNNLETLKNGKGPSGGDEKAWTGKVTGVKPGVYVACSTNFKACQLFTKNPGQDATVYIIYGSTPGSTIPGTPPGQGAPDEKVCTTGEGLAGALAWVLCPAVQLIASATNFFENNIIIPFMTVSPLTTAADNPIYILWQNIRNVANIGFIIFFFIVIFSQATSIGISNYGIKRILPKMAVVVIGVNLSYFIVAFVIDAFNIFGAGISSLVTAALQQAGTTQLNTGSSSGSVRSIFTLGGAALLTIVVTGGAAIGWFFSFLGLALLVVVVVVIVLVVRQMAIIMLVIVSPVAILMYMLPNTEAYYNKWRKMLTQLLMMYPMIVLLFAAGKIFGIILQQPDFKIAGDGVSDDVAQAVRVILQFVVYVVPLVFLPATFAASGSLMGKAFGFLHNARTTGFAKKGGSSLNENVIKPRRQEMGARAARRGGAIGWAAGYGARRDFKKEQRERELGRARQEYISNQALNNEGFAGSAAGIGGAAGATRVQAGAVSQLEKSRQEEMANEGAILSAQLRSAGISEKEFNKGFTKYLEGTGPATLAGTTGSVNVGDQRTMRAALNAAAAAGEVHTMEQARMNLAPEHQGMVDDVIRNNDGKLKGKGGYHLATDFNLANGRMQNTNYDRATSTRSSAPIDMNAPDAHQQMNFEVERKRLEAVANTAAADIADMKSGTLDDLQKSIFETDTDGNVIMTAGAPTVSTKGASLIANMKDTDVTQLKSRLADIHGNANLLGKAQNREAIVNLHNFLP